MTPINQSIQCNRDGYRIKKNLTTQRSTTVSSIHCKAHIYVKLDTELGQWRLLKAGIQSSKTFQALADEAGGRSNLKFEEKDVRNYISGKLRLYGDDTDAQEMLDYFTRMKEQNLNFFYDILSIVTIVSSMYFRRMLDQKLLMSILVTWYHLTPHTSSTSLRYQLQHLWASITMEGHVSSGVLYWEEIESFEWLMQIFAKCMEKTPDGILTDHCGAMAIAIQNVMPNTKHRLCI
ncbi:hypothetical protein AHAS_Ahas18G0142600 [Arachis hypogaea]